MNKVTSEEEQEILKSSQTGAFALLLAFGALLLGAWLLLYFGRHMALGRTVGGDCLAGSQPCPGRNRLY